jgi:pimeloyl-ACP methyl ester carboxylesterase
MMNGFRNPQRKHLKTPFDIGIAFEEVRFKTKNNRSLYGWWIVKNKNYPTIILVHGWGRNVGRMIPYIEQLNSQSYNLLTFDARHHGSSDKDKLSTMKKFAEDISSAIDFVQEKIKDRKPKIGIIGLSIGGGAAIYASAHDKRINCIITVGAFANPLDVMKIQLAKRNVPYYPIGWILLKYLEFLVGFKFNDIAPENHIQQSESKILLIHGTNDQTIPISHAERLLNKSKKQFVELWKIKNRGHSDCHEETGYWKKIIDYLNSSFS